MDSWLQWTVGSSALMTLMLVPAWLRARNLTAHSVGRTWARRARAWLLIGLASAAVFLPVHWRQTFLWLLGDNWGLAVWPRRLPWAGSSPSA